MTDDGGCIAVLLQVDPKQRNFTLAAVHAFDPAERMALRGAIIRCRARKAKALDGSERFQNELKKQKS